MPRPGCKWCKKPTGARKTKETTTLQDLLVSSTLSVFPLYSMAFLCQVNNQLKGGLFRYPMMQCRSNIMRMCLWSFISLGYYLTRAVRWSPHYRLFMSSVELGLQVNTHPSNLALSRFLVTVLKNICFPEKIMRPMRCVFQTSWKIVRTSLPSENQSKVELHSQGEYKVWVVFSCAPCTPRNCKRNR